MNALLILSLVLFPIRAVFATDIIIKSTPSTGTNSVTPAMPVQDSDSSTTKQLRRRFELSPVFGLTATSPSGNLSSSINYGAGAGFGGGMLFNFNITRKFSLETDVLFLQRIFSLNISGSGGKVSLTANTIELPFMARYWFLPYLSVGGGFYFAPAVGNLSTSASGQTQSVSYDSAGYKTLDYGLVSSVQFRYPVSRFLAILVDTRFVVGVPNLDTTGDSPLTYRLFEFLSGVSFSF